LVSFVQNNDNILDTTRCNTAVPPQATAYHNAIHIAVRWPRAS